MSGKGGKKNEDSRQASTRKTKAAVDHRQNNSAFLNIQQSGVLTALLGSYITGVT